MRTCVLLMVLAFAPPVRAADAPPAYHVVYEIGTSKLDARWDGHKGALTVARTGTTNTLDPWPAADAQALWRELERAKIFEFKPEKGPSAPDFTEVHLAVEADVNGAKKAADLKWDAPLKNDGAIWPVLNQLDGLAAPPPPSFGPPPSPAASTAPAASPGAPVPSFNPAPPESPATPDVPPPPASPATPAPAPSGQGRVEPPPGEVEALIATLSTELPLARVPLEPAPRIDRALYARALEQLSVRIAARPRSAELHTLRAAAYVDLGQPARALDDFTAACRLEPRRAAHRYNRGVLLARLGLLADAHRDLARAHKLGPGQFEPAAIVMAGVPTRSWLGRAGRHLLPPRVDLR